MSETNTNTDKILRRVRKMMRLAECAGATEGERDNALRMVHATLAKYNISMSQVEAGDNSKQEQRGKLREAYLGKPWAIQISAAIARMCFCHYYYSTMGGNAGPTQKAMHTFVGLESNTITAKEMSMFVVDSVNKEANRYRRQIGAGYAEYRAFAQGAAAKIRARCDALVEEAKRKGVQAQDTDADEPELLSREGAGTALVLASLYQSEADANKKWLEDMNITLGKGRSQSIDPSRGFAHRAGVQYGASVSLQRQVGSSGTNKRIK